MEKPNSLKKEIAKNAIKKFEPRENQITTPIPEITIQARELQELITELYKRLGKNITTQNPANNIKRFNKVSSAHRDKLNQIRNNRQAPISASQN